MVTSSLVLDLKNSHYPRRICACSDDLESTSINDPDSDLAISSCIAMATREDQKRIRHDAFHLAFCDSSLGHSSPCVCVVSQPHAPKIETRCDSY